MKLIYSLIMPLYVAGLLTITMWPYSFVQNAAIHQIKTHGYLIGWSYHK